MLDPPWHLISLLFALSTVFRDKSFSNLLLTHPRYVLSMPLCMCEAHLLGKCWGTYIHALVGVSKLIFFIFLIRWQFLHYPRLPLVFAREWQKNVRASLQCPCALSMCHLWCFKSAHSFTYLMSGTIDWLRIREICSVYSSLAITHHQVHHGGSQVCSVDATVYFLNTLARGMLRRLQSYFRRWSQLVWSHLFFLFFLFVGRSCTAKFTIKLLLPPPMYVLSMSPVWAWSKLARGGGDIRLLCSAVVLC